MNNYSQLQIASATVFITETYLSVCEVHAEVENSVCIFELGKSMAFMSTNLKKVTFERDRFKFRISMYKKYLF
jgi:hypothetical protein